MASTFEGITLLGLGPGDPALLTRQAWEWLNQIPEVWLRTRQHPTLAGFPAGLKVFSFDEFYEQSDQFEKVYAQIVERVLELGARPGGVTYAVPGHPMVAEATGPEIYRRAQAAGIAVRVIEGLSFLEPTCSALGIDPFPAMALVDAMDLASAHHPLFSPETPALVAQVYSRQIASEVKLTLAEVYPDEHPVRLVHGAGTDYPLVEDLHLYEIDRSSKIGLLTSLYVPPLGENVSFEGFQEIVAHLRAPDGCPWDREQTHQSLRNDLIEETYELVEAIDTDDVGSLQEELGDLLLILVMQAQIASEEGEFRLEDALRGISQKMIRRHPHVFANTQVAGVGDVLKNWEKIKEEERQKNGQVKVKGILDGLSKALPALALAQSYQDRAAHVGFDWKEEASVWAKFEEELRELREASSPEARAAELGDVLFALVNLIRWHQADAESLLRQANQRFYQRFAYIEAAARAQERKLADLSLEEMDTLWQVAKKKIV